MHWTSKAIILANFEWLLLHSYYSSELRTELLKFSNCYRDSEIFSLKLLKAFCEEIRFEIYQKGIALNNNQKDYHGLDDILFEDKIIDGADLKTQKSAAEYYENDKSSLVLQITAM